ncbi:hypothetical protein FUA26_10705 [Seonamhaeicola algicola]|uniref:HTH luxR-type domain-containing protein n=1 Tax=Seonamhaeicola algicola TaxID=1719036 RepID=A0A5C7ATX6_9FLAO|nr:hypothetical protein [Seonamhaeicola algicola]TXE09945.1 hypothetical protein FUA26_10705 [Seonamhaeicola algicola]
MRLKCIFFFLISLWFGGQFVFSASSLNSNDLNLKLNIIDFEIIMFNRDLHNLFSSDFQDMQDDKSAINKMSALMIKADNAESEGNYSKAYDLLWEALLLAEKYDNRDFLVRCHYELGLLYLVFNKEEEAVGHMKRGLEYQKKQLKLKTVTERDLIRNYLGIAASYTRSRKFQHTNFYLDSCLVIAEKYKVKPYYILAEKANAALLQDKLDEAEEILDFITPYFLKNNSHFAVVTLSYFGNLKLKQSKLDKALYYYNLCLEIMENNNAHKDIQPEVLHKLAQIYSSKGMDGKAYRFMYEANRLNDSLFSAKNNGDLLDVKNKYRKEVNKKNKEMAQQQKLLSARKQQNFQLKISLGFIVLIIISTIMIVKNWYQRKQFLERRNKSKLKAQHEKEKQAEVINVKNKEITSYTLQLIDKERVIDDLLQELKKHLNEVDYRMLFNATKDFNKNLWNEFNERFTNVNTSFYEKLRKRYPMLSSTELKHCALIKLNFNGKEMAQLLNISLPSVHIARHRLRKKFNLERGDNLAKFISEI